MTCPDSFTMEKLLFWTLGYGGWLGVALLPTVWSLPSPASKSVKMMVSFLMPPMVAILITGFFYSVYGFAYITHTVSSAMINPVFLRSCIGMVCISLASVGLYMTQCVDRKTHINADTDEAEDATKDVGSSDDSEGEDTDEDAEGEEDVGDSESSDADNAIPAPINVNTDILRNAPPLSDE
jgi:hypothetical protein